MIKNYVFIVIVSIVVYSNNNWKNYYNNIINYNKENL